MKLENFRADFILLETIFWQKILTESPVPVIDLHTYDENTNVFEVPQN